jgi:pimeloyl-ACP methyl ester carboxylesterase
MITKNGFTAAEQSVPIQPQTPYFREAGSGTSVVCIHSSASSSGQWRTLMERLADRFRVIAVDLYGSGKTAAWPQGQPMHLDDEVALLSSVFRAAGDRFHLIGHSFGGAIALKAGLANRDRVFSLVLYEPVLFSVLIADAPESAAAREIFAVRDDTIRLVDEGNLNASAQRFVDYWMDDGTWAATPEPRRPVLAAAMRAVKSEWHALLYEPTPLSAFAAVNVPTLFLTGTKSKAPALAVARLVTSVLTRVHPRGGFSVPAADGEFFSQFRQRSHARPPDSLQRDPDRNSNLPTGLMMLTGCAAVAAFSGVIFNLAAIC